jgi:hypothetical protein
MKKFHIIWFGLIFLITIIGFIRGCINTQDLEQSFEVTSGWVIGKSGSKNGDTIDYYFKLDGREIDGRSIGGGILCQRYAKNRVRLIKGLLMPIVYERGDPENNRLLLFKSEYAKFRVAVPEELREVVEEMSKCEE